MLELRVRVCWMVSPKPTQYRLTCRQYTKLVSSYRQEMKTGHFEDKNILWQSANKASYQKQLQLHVLHTSSCNLCLCCVQSAHDIHNIVTKHTNKAKYNKETKIRHCLASWHTWHTISVAGLTTVSHTGSHIECIWGLLQSPQQSLKQASDTPYVRPSVRHCDQAS